jgi:hypothetical protein
MFLSIAQMNSRKRAHLIVVGLALVGVLASCGGDDGDETAASMTKDQFLKKANAICSQVFDEIDRKYGKLSNESTEAELNEQAQEIVPPLVSRLVDRLRALGAPTGEEARLDRILAALEEGVETAEEDVRTVRGSQGEFAFGEGYEMLWDYGLTSCGLSDG